MGRKKDRKQRQREHWAEQKKRRKTIRHNTAANQEKHRLDWQPLEPNADGVVPDRRIMPRDEQGRRAIGAWLAAQPVSGPAGENNGRRRQRTPYLTWGLCRPSGGASAMLN